MKLLDFELLSQVGLNQYERQTLIALLKRGVADAATLCEDGEIPTSKIYLATEKLEQMGLISVQRSRPRMFAALSPEDAVERLGALAREEADKFAQATKSLVEAIRSSTDASAGSQTFADMALGPRQHIRRHVVHLASARESVVSYMEQTDIDAISQSHRDGFPVLKKIRKNAESGKIDHRVVFGFSYREGPSLMEFLRSHQRDLRSTTGIRYAGVLGHPFHVVDGELVILSLDNAFLPEKRFASLLIRNLDLATALVTGFETLWSKAMKGLQEIDVHPGALRADG